MSLTAIDHVLVLSDDIDGARDFYCAALGLEAGERPPLPFAGHWLYAAGAPRLHVADRAEYHEHRLRIGLPPAAGSADTIDHIAFVATDYELAAARLESAGVAAVRNAVPGARLRQLFFSAPDGVRIEINVSDPGGDPMRAALTRAVRAMEIVDVPEPPSPSAGEVIVRSEAVGLCGSDYHFLLGELTDAAGGSQFPRIQGHEVGATIAAVGPDCRPDLTVGRRVALFPLHACGHCYPCSVGRPNTCDNFELIGIHRDGALQQMLRIGQEQVFPIDVDDGAVAAMAEPLSIAVRAMHRGRVERGEKVVVLGAGPIGQCICLLANEVGADVLLVDLQERRLTLGRDFGADGLRWRTLDETVRAARDWAGGGGPAVAIDATGAAPAVRAMVDMVASAGRVVQVGMSGDEVALRIGSFTEKEIDMVGVSCCGGGEFGEAVAAVERNAAALTRLISDEFPLERTPEAIEHAIANPAEVMKVMIRVG